MPVENYIYWQDRWWRAKSLRRAEVLYLNHTVDLLSGERRESELQEVLSNWLSLSFHHYFEKPLFVHLGYELGHIFNETGPVSSDQVLALFSEYEDLEEVELSRREPLSFKLVNSPRKSEYLAAFKRGYEHLLRGDCYQFNLTYPFEWESKEDVEVWDFLCALKEVSSYAHAVSVRALGLSLFSNSPESLFEREGQELVTRPIKGTIKESEGKEQLLASKKDLAELDMITDLLRNDLNRIDRPTARVRKRQEVLQVPGLFHQYSEVALALAPQVTLLEAVRALFPSGSITGAPKKRVMEILREIESRERSFYCGSTLFGFKDTLRASVNIRTGLYDHERRLLRYQAGGGCTLLSVPELEFQEMQDKVASFFGNIS